MSETDGMDQVSELLVLPFALDLENPQVRREFAMVARFWAAHRAAGASEDALMEHFAPWIESMRRLSVGIERAKPVTD